MKGPESISEKTKEIERAVFEYTNIERKKYGLKELKWDEKLSEIAREHSLDMAQNNFFDHVNLEGEDPTQRAVRNDYHYLISENIGEMPTGSVEGIGYVSNNPEDVAKAQVNAWMESPGHRMNLLAGQHSWLGVGVAYDGLYYFLTQDFK